MDALHNLHDEAVEQGKNITFAGANREPANIDRATSSLDKIWVVRKRVLEMLLEQLQAGESALTVDAHDQGGCPGLGTYAASRR